MKIVKPSVTLIRLTEHPEELIEECGKVCYKSEASITPSSAACFIRKRIADDHHSVLEHAVATIRIICDRGVSHQIVRHRLMSVSQESTRYCNYSHERFGTEIAVIQPPGLESVFNRPTNMDPLALWKRTMEVIEDTYLTMLGQGIQPQIARSVLPNCLKTELVITANLREWRHILMLRTSKKAHPQAREVMLQAGRLLKQPCPNVFHDMDFGKEAKT